MKVDAYPRATVRWYLNGKEIQPSKDFGIDQLEDGTSILTMSEVFPDDAGEIMCEAHNDKGVATSVVHLNITGQLIFLSLLNLKSYKSPLNILKQRFPLVRTN